jgi:hypothetical protein
MMRNALSTLSSLDRQRMSFIKKGPKKSSIYIGVSRYHLKNCKKTWIAIIRDKKLNNKCKRKRKYFETQNEAAIQYNEWAIALYGDAAMLNKIIDTPETTSKNPLWLTSKFGKYWKKKSKKEIINTIIENTTSVNSEDNSYVIEFINGSNTAFDFLFKKHYKNFVRNIIHQRKKSDCYKKYVFDIDEIVQEGIMKCMHSIKKGRFSGVSFKAWSAIVMRNVYSSYIRKKYSIPSYYTLNTTKKHRKYKVQHSSSELLYDSNGCLIN